MKVVIQRIERTVVHRMGNQSRNQYRNNKSANKKEVDSDEDRCCFSIAVEKPGGKVTEKKTVKMKNDQLKCCKKLIRLKWQVMK